MTTPITLEVCVDCIESAHVAAREGAKRIELCASLNEHGLTPSAGMIATVRDLVSIDLFVMIRPRGGDFVYSEGEFAAMKHDIATAKALGADGVVFGILNEDRTIDRGRNAELLALARPMKATFHRAFDVSRDLTQSLEDIVALGFDRVLTSGGAQKVEDAVPVVSGLRELSADRIALMIGAGVNSANVRSLIEQTGVREVHASARRIAPSAPRRYTELIAMDTLAAWEQRHSFADEEEVRDLVRAISTIG
ncbi:MAG TPA: copper homeostasis protein CutC [Terriglobales bacterium]|nr:copper homeostasis protein CutC [Terriglobales bacterium]